MESTSDNHKKRRMALVIGVISICAISMIGVGYAVITGQVFEGSNTSDTDYILMTFNDDEAGDYIGQFTKEKIKYNTVVDSSGKRWIPKYNADTDGDSVNDAVKTGNVTLHVEVTGDFTYTLSMAKSSGTMDTTLFVVGIKIGNAAETFIEFGATEFVIAEDLTGDKDMEISLYYKAPESTVKPPKAVDGVNIVIIATADDE